METKRQKRPGRPKRGAADVLRARVWFMAVENESGKTANALEMEFRGATAGIRRLPGLWGKYARGEVSPSAELVNAVESVYPGTARWFNHPLWRLVRNTPITFEELKPIFFELGVEARNLLVFEAGREEVFWRKPADLGTIYQALLDLEALDDSVTGILLLIKEAEFRQDLRQFAAGLTAWTFVRQRMTNTWPFSGSIGKNQKSILRAIEALLLGHCSGIRYTSDGRNWTSVVASASTADSP